MIFKRTHLLLAALGAATLGLAPVAGAQTPGASGGGCSDCGARPLTEAERRRIAQVRRDLERAVERARNRIDELRESSEYGDAEAHALRQAKIALEQAEPATPEFRMSMARLRALAASDQARFFEDPQFKSAFKDVSRLQEELALRMVPRTRRGYLGVSFPSGQDVLPGGRVVYSFSEYPEILEVSGNSPAAQAGVRRGDVLLALNGRDVVRQGPIMMSDLLVPGETVRLRLRRDGRTMELPVKVGQAREVAFMMVRPGGAASAPALPPLPATAPLPRQSRVTVQPAPQPPELRVGTMTWTSDGVRITSMVMFGAEMQSMDRDQRDLLEVDQGVLVANVLANTVAAQTGLRSLDVVVRVDDDRVATPDQIREAIQRAQRAGADSVVLTLARKNRERKVTLRW